MKRLLAVLVLVAVSVRAETFYSDTSGYWDNLFFYKNEYSQDNQILNASSPNSFRARYGYWDFTSQLFTPVKNFYPWLFDPYFEPEGEPEPIYVTFSPAGMATLSGLVHPYIPWADFPNGYGSRHYSPPGPSEGIGIEFSYTESSFVFSSIIVLNSPDGDWISGNDQAVVGQIHQTQNGGTAITMVPEPSSLSLLVLGGAVLMAGRRRNRETMSPKG